MSGREARPAHMFDTARVSGRQVMDLSVRPWRTDAVRSIITRKWMCELVRGAAMRLFVCLALVVSVVGAALSAHAQPAARNPNGVAIIIGNKDYQRPGVPAVDFADRDAEAMRRFVIDGLGYDPKNVHVILNAKRADLYDAFGEKDTPRRSTVGKWVDGNPQAEVLVYYSGHGMPDLDSRQGYLLPVDADPNRPARDGYSIDLLRENLSKLSVRQVVVILDACFSGDSAGGALVKGVSGFGVEIELPPAAQRMAVLTAASGRQFAGWDRQTRHGLFTDRLLSQIYAGDGRQVTVGDVRRSVVSAVQRSAWSDGRRDQTPEITGADGIVLAAWAGGRPPARPTIGGAPAPTPAVAIMPPPAPPATAPAPSAEAIEAAMTLSPDQRRQVQGWLLALGFDPRGVDGQFGPGTRGAIRAFQRSKSLPETGFLTAETVAGLAADGPVALAKADEARRARDAAQAALAAVRPAPVPSAPSSGGGVYPVGIGQSFRDGDGPEMVVIPPGSFTMGSPASEAGRENDEGPQRTVQVREALAVGKFHVTVGEYRRFAEATGRGAPACNFWDGSKWVLEPSRTWRSPGFAQSDRHPVVCVSWEDAQAYARWLSQRTGRGYRLLTEAEWEYVARAGTRTSRWWGDGEAGQCNAANGADASGKRAFGWGDGPATCDDGHAATSPVGSFRPNGFGLFDMAGNAWQWVEDCWKDNYQGSPTDSLVALVSGGDCGRRVLRGGSWISFPRLLRSADRIGFTPGNRYDIIGFRVARTPGG
jgi:formylglycine-generating enzyme required for sulfatase activity